MNNGDTPHVIIGSQQDYKRLFFSDYEDALILPVSVGPGFGVLKQGTAMAKNLSAAGNTGKLVPYNPTSFDGTQDHPGRSYLVSNITSGSSDNEFYVTQDDSRKFIVGDDVIVNDSSETAVNLGAVTAIDRTTYPHMAKITTTSPAGANFTTGNNAYLAHEAGVSANNYSDCVGILGRAIDTGTGKNAQGAIGQLIISHAILYTGMLVNFDAAAIADISSTTFGKYTVLK